MAPANSATCSASGSVASSGTSRRAISLRCWVNRRVPSFWLDAEAAEPKMQSSSVNGL